MCSACSAVFTVFVIRVSLTAAMQPFLPSLLCAALHRHPALQPLLPAPAVRRALISSSEIQVRSYGPLVVASSMPGSFEKRLSQLRTLSEANDGYAQPTNENTPDPSLVRWAARQRTLRRQGTLSTDAVDDLDSVGFVWDPLQAAWEARLHELEEFFAANGHYNVPSTDATLFGWVARQ